MSSAVVMMRSLPLEIRAAVRNRRQGVRDRIKFNTINGWNKRPTDASRITEPRLKILCARIKMISIKYLN